MKKVLILTYYWPPSGGAGVQRWLKFSKYLSESGWEPVIYTSEGGEYPAIDHSLEKDVRPGITVLRTRPREPYSFYKKLLGYKKSEKVAAGFLAERKQAGLMQKLSVWIRGNFFIPDARKFWIQPSVKYLSEWLGNNRVDAMISTGPPHSMHLIALALKRKFNIPWVADFRDPWTNIDFYSQLMLTTAADRKHKRLEKEVLSSADRIVTVSWHWADDFKKLCGREVSVITNGYDEEDFPAGNRTITDEFAFHHIGALNKDRNPHFFWKALADCIREEKEFSKSLKIRLAGKTDYTVFDSLEKNGLMPYVEKVEYMPHSEITRFTASSPVLLLPLNDTPNVLGIIPGKLFEYLAARRPIFGIGDPQGDSARIIREAGAGEVFGFREEAKMKAAILKLFSQFKQGGLSNVSGSIEQYSRRNGARKFAAILNEMV